MVASRIYNNIGKSYESTLAELSSQFWAGMGDTKPDIAYDDEDQSVQTHTVLKTPDIGHDLEHDICNAPHSSIQNTRDSTSVIGPLVVNGITLSHVTATQLKKLGLPLEWYTSDELEDAAKACQVDSTLVDDHHGHNFQDKLSLDPHEKEEHHDIPTLHGFHKDEYEHIIAGVRTNGRKRLKSAMRQSAQLDCEQHRQVIDAGLRMLSNPCDIKTNQHYNHGLEAAPHKQREHELGLAA